MNQRATLFIVVVIVILFGFLVFIAYPAVSQITSISGPQP